MKKTSFPGFGFFLVFFIGALTGCGTGAKPVGVIKGQVFLGDAPLTEAKVSFRLKEGESPLTYQGTTNEEGKFDIPIPRGQGFKGGTFQVVVSKQVAKSGKIDKDLDPGPGQLEISGETKELVPSRYSNVEESQLQVELKEGENNLDPIKLKK